jgi:hypothetical protein
MMGHSNVFLSEVHEAVRAVTDEVPGRDNDNELRSPRYGQR